MKLRAVILENFRCYRERVRIPVENLTVFVGKNDAGKSSVFDALAIFFDHPLGKAESGDLSVGAAQDAEMRIGCEFDELPQSVVIDTTSSTTLADEYLLNSNGKLEIHRVWATSNGKLGKSRTVAIAEHPSAPDLDQLLQKKNADLKKQVQQANLKRQVDLRSNVAMRQALWQNAAGCLAPTTKEIQLDKEDAKTIWEQVFRQLPEYALFRADRPCTDEDSEVQDPLKVAVRQALKQVEADLANIQLKVKEQALDVARRTIEKLRDFDPTMASALEPDFKAEPKWDGIFKLALNCEDGIPVNKRGSGLRRLILFSFFRAEAERLQTEHGRGEIIYAIEEPETAQHPSNQRLVVQALTDLAEREGTQVMLTTHVPGMAGLVPTGSVVYIRSDGQGAARIAPGRGSDAVLEEVAQTLGVSPDQRVRVLLCVEGPNDVAFLTCLAALLRDAGEVVPDVAGDPRIAFVPLGGSTLREWVARRYLKNLGLPEVHIYDRDADSIGQTPKYEGEVNRVNARGNRDCAFMTKKREMENYLHHAAVERAAAKAGRRGVSLRPFTDEDDIEARAKEALTGTCLGRNVKAWLNHEAARELTLAELRERGCIDELKAWFDAVSARLQ